MRSKAIDYAEANVQAAFEFAERLVRAQDLREIASVQQEFLRRQSEQMREQMRALSTVGSMLSVHVGAEEQGENAADAVRAMAEETAELLAHLDTVEEMTRRALDLLSSTRNDVYEAALAALHEDTREWWQETFGENAEEPDDDEEVFTADAARLRRFLEEEVLPWYPARRQELANRPLIQEQAYGEALDPKKLERLGRYEVHLDRKLERTLAMLLKLKELQRATEPG
jgi:Phasin protein